MSLSLCVQTYMNEQGTTVQWSVHNVLHCLVARLVNSHTTADLHMYYVQWTLTYPNTLGGTHPCSYLSEKFIYVKYYISNGSL